MEQELMAITGLTEGEAKMYLEMSGNNLEIAIQLFFEQGGADLGGGFQDNNDNNNQQNEINNPNNSQDITPETILWPQKNNIPESWQIQGITFDQNNPWGLDQHQNGPCGPLSVINAVLISQLLKGENPDMKRPVTVQELSRCLTTILQISSTEEKYIILDQNINSFQEAQQFIEQNIQKFQQPGGLVQFLYSLILTKGPENIKKEVLQSGSELPLIVAPFYICVTDLIMLMLTGTANGNVGDFDQMTLKKIPIDNKLQIGVLSSSVHQINIPINDALLSPENNVYILHGGEHFSTLFTFEKDINQQSALYYHWNGLKPGGPRMCQIQIKHEGEVLKKNVEPEVYHKNHQQYQPVLGEIDSVIQAKKEDKDQFPKNHEKWNYEVALVVHDEKDAKYPPRPEDWAKPKTYEQGSIQPGPWRCLACYNKRFETMCFGQNEDGADSCQHCQQKREYCGWSIYMHYDELPGGFKASLNRQHGPKILGILEIKWKNNLSIEFLDNEEAPTV